MTSVVVLHKCHVKHTSARQAIQCCIAFDPKTRSWQLAHRSRNLAVLLRTMIGRIVVPKSPIVKGLYTSAGVAVALHHPEAQSTYLCLPIRINTYDASEWPASPHKDDRSFGTYETATCLAELRLLNFVVHSWPQEGEECVPDMHRHPTLLQKSG